MSSITYILGTRDSGKTSLIKEVAARIPDAIGVIAEKCFDSEGNVVGYDAIMFPSGERLPHCRRYQDEVFTECHGGFWFDGTVFSKVNQYILSNIEGRDTVIIDEIGSLEMKHHQGYYPTLETLMQQHDDLHLILALRG